MARTSDKFFSTFLLKIASRCNLNCSYCYVYNRGDTTWRQRPALMSRDTHRAALEQIRSHVVKHALPEVGLVYHGGEPLLAGVKRFRAFLSDAYQVFGDADFRVSVGLQTNATLVSEEWLDLLEEAPYRVGLGVSIDGGSEAFNSRRVHLSGETAFPKILAGVNQLKKRPVIWSRTGFLKVIDPFENSVEVATTLVNLGLKRCDFLQPLVHWACEDLGDREEYQNAMVAYWRDLVDWWWSQNEDTALEIRTFVTWGSHLLGVSGGVDAWGGGPSHILSIETDGAYELTDSYKVVANGFPGLGYSVSEEIDEVFKSEKLRWLWDQAVKLSPKCLACEFRTVCGGGYLPSRYNGVDFQEPSFHCRGIKAGVTALQERLLDEIKEVNVLSPCTAG